MYMYERLLEWKPALFYLNYNLIQLSNDGYYGHCMVTLVRFYDEPVWVSFVQYIECIIH